MPITKTQRWLDLIAFLVKRRFPVTVEDIMDGVPSYAEKWRTADDTARASVRRMFERDKDELRAAGIPLETRPHRVEGLETQGYVLVERDLYLPYLRLVGAKGSSAPGAVEITPDEARLAMDALRRVAELPDSPFAADARSALAKLRFDLAPLGVEEPAPVLYADAVRAGHGADLLLRLTAALRERRRARFTYHGIGRGEATERDVAPYGLLFQGGHWYMVGLDATRDAVRTFRLDRVEGLETGPGGEFEHDAGFDLSAFAGRRPWEMGDDVRVMADVRFDFPLSLWAERNAEGEEVERRAGGIVVRRFAVRQPDAFLRWLQTFGGDAVVEAPPPLREAQTELAAETAALYEAAGGG